MYYLILPDNTHTRCAHPASQHIGFSVANRDYSFGHQLPSIVPNYNLLDYIHDFGTCKVKSAYRDDNYKWVEFEETLEGAMLRDNPGYKAYTARLLDRALEYAETFHP